MQLIFKTLLFVCLSCHVIFAAGQELSSEELVAALQQGGHIIFMRHANAPGELPTEATAEDGNDGLERQLDDKGKRDATNFGKALSRLNIPLSSIESSPTFRTRQTARLAGYSNFELRDFLLQETAEMPEEVVSRLREELKIKPESGNRMLVSHSGNVMAIYPDLYPYIEQGEALIIKGTGTDFILLGRIAITEWPEL